MAAMFLKLGAADGESKVEKHSRKFRRFPARVNVDHRRHSGLAEGDRFAVKPVLVFALEAAIGMAVCAGTILAIFAWTGASL
jgi:hypothetical protein